MIFTWKLFTCLFKLNRLVNLVSHFSHANFLPSCITWISLFKFDFSTNIASHLLHLKDFSLSWKHCTCFWTLVFKEKLISYNGHLNGFFPSWTDAKWKVKLSSLRKLLPYIWHYMGLLLYEQTKNGNWAIFFTSKISSQRVHLYCCFPP